MITNPQNGEQISLPTTQNIFNGWSEESEEYDATVIIGGTLFFVNKIAAVRDHPLGGVSVFVQGVQGFFYIPDITVEEFAEEIS